MSLDQRKQMLLYSKQGSENIPPNIISQLQI